MIEYKNLNYKEKSKLYDKAYTWKFEHQSHIEKMMEGIAFPIPPSEQDMFQPELWKGIHWKWFINEWGG